MKNTIRTIYKRIPSGLLCLGIVIGLFCSIGAQMGAANMLNTIMKTAHDLYRFFRFEGKISTK